MPCVPPPTTTLCCASAGGAMVDISAILPALELNPRSATPSLKHLSWLKASSPARGLSCSSATPHLWPLKTPHHHETVPAQQVWAAPWRNKDTWELWLKNNLEEFSSVKQSKTRATRKCVTPRNTVDCLKRVQGKCPGIEEWDAKKNQRRDFHLKIQHMWINKLHLPRTVLY